jgi:hypothetical protein
MTTQINASIADPTISVQCPKCNRPAGEPCREPSGAKAKKPHADRVRAAESLESNAPAAANEPLRAPSGGAPEVPADIRKDSICIIIKTSRFTTRRTVAQADVTVEATDDKKSVPDQDMVTVAKDLLDSAELRRIATFDHITKLWVKARSVPSPLLRSGAYMFSINSLEDMYGYLEQRKKDREPLMDEFAAAYPGLVRAAKIKLGPLFDAKQYPPADVIKREFSFDWQVIEIDTPNEKLRSVSQALFEKEKAKAEMVWSSAVGQINDALAAGMAEVVAHLAERMGDGDEAPKRFRASAVKKVQDFLDNFAGRNLANSAELTKLVTDAKKLLSGVDAKELKKDGELRKRVVQGFGEIKASLDGMLENKPMRAFAAKDDEV